MLFVTKEVVLYLHSTSNHNCKFAQSRAIRVVLYLHSTSNHNLATHLRWVLERCIISSFYIKPQHSPSLSSMMPSCIISSFYIKPQRKWAAHTSINGCIISSFYIKPQPCRSRRRCCLVVLYLHSTSNHNIYHLHYWYSAVWKPYWVIWSCLMRLI